MSVENTPTVVITGAAKRIGKEITKMLHGLGFNVVIHYLNSTSEAQTLCRELNAIRDNSAITLAANLEDISALETLIDQSYQHFQRLDLLVNNASSFYPTPIGQSTEAQWDELFAHNVKGAFFLCQKAAPYLQRQQGQIINITDIHSDQPLKNYTIYCAAKAALSMLTRSLAKELAPVRVNSIAPGAILWPEGEATLTDAQQENIIEKIPLKRAGTPADIAHAVAFLVEQRYITGQTLNVAGGRQHLS